MIPNSEINVIILGGNHHNTLSVIRCFGRNGYHVEAVIHETSNKNKFVDKSKYAKNIYFIDNKPEAISRWLYNYKSDFAYSILFPCSDLAMQTIDTDKEELSKYYYVPGYLDYEKKTTYMMDKWHQIEFALRNQIKVARSALIKLNNVNLNTISFEVFPCVLKPLISANGRKADITICNDKNEFLDALVHLKDIGYNEILVQEYLKKIREEFFAGVIVSDKIRYYGAIIKRIRDYPIRKGSTSYGVTSDDFTVKSINEGLINLLWKDGYRGQIDVEYFVCKDGVYLNEINYRHSGNGYVLINSGLPAPEIGVHDIIGDAEYYSNYNSFLKPNIYCIDERSDILHCISHYIKVSDFQKSLRKASVYAIWSKDDIRPCFYAYLFTIKNVVYKIFRGMK